LKLLLWHCELVAYKDKRLSTRPEKLRGLPRKKSAAQFKNVIAVFTCIESGDNHNHANSAVKEILSYAEMLGGKKEIVVIPFVHLSSKIAEPDVAIQIIAEIIRSLKLAGLSVHEASFGFHKDFELHFRGHGHPGSVSFRSIPKKGENNHVPV
jgi:threonyl-tRNA synthetase